MTIRSLIWCCGLFALLILGMPTPSLQAAPISQIITVEGPTLRGALPYQYNAHYLGLSANVRDGVVELTLAYDPQNNPNLKGFVNFYVLDQDGLRRFLAGTDPELLALAGGAPLQFDPMGNKMGAAFRASGHGPYTVIVYNNSLLPVTYTLTVKGGILVDSANQTLPRTASSFAPEPAVTPIAVDMDLLNPLGSASGQRLTGSLSNTIGRHYLTAVPAIRDGTILFNFHYDPLDQPALQGNVNFWVLDQAGLNAIIRGDKPGSVNLATGFPAPFSPFPNDLQANFNASGKEPYTVVIYNQTSIPASYDLIIDGGMLYDRYGQTAEAKAAAVITNLGDSQSSNPVTIQPLLPTTDAGSTTSLISVSADTLSAVPLGVSQLVGSFQQSYQYHYAALWPTTRNGTVVLSLAFDPSDSKVVRENLNFWVLTEEGLQQVINGAPPTAYDIATGAYQEFGPYKGKLYAAFTASGYGKYTVIVFTNTDTPARYLLNADGGLMATEDMNVALP